VVDVLNWIFWKIRPDFSDVTEINWFFWVGFFERK
jgi:hypothetical protein